MTDQSARLAYALEIVRVAGEIALRYYQGQNLRIEEKMDRTVVTRADREAEAELRGLIEKRFPRDKIVGEEHGVKDGDSGWTWYLDPIDGTQAYARGVPLFGNLIGVECGGESRIGVIFMPALGEMIWADKGGGCHWMRGMRLDGKRWHDGDVSQAQVSGVSTMQHATYCTTWMQSFTAIGRQDLFTKLAAAAGYFRGWGDCYGYLLVATGRADIMVDPQLQIWDAAPLMICIQEAGGVYTSLGGKADIHAGSGIATNGRLHDEVLRICR